jgi:hypothetical protein
LFLLHNINKEKEITSTTQIIRNSHW